MGVRASEVNGSLANGKSEVVLISGAARRRGTTPVCIAEETEPDADDAAAAAGCWAPLGGVWSVGPKGLLSPRALLMVCAAVCPGGQGGGVVGPCHKETGGGQAGYRQAKVEKESAELTLKWGAG